MNTGTSQRSVLVVEDDPGLVDLYARRLRESYDVRTATTEAEAFECLDDTVDVVTLDRQLPDGSGDDILEEIRARSIGCRVVMVSGLEPDADVLSLGVDDYLVKPVTLDDLEDAVDAAIDRSVRRADASGGYEVPTMEAENHGAGR